MNFPISIRAYAEAKDLTIREAILDASVRGLILCNHEAPIDDARRDIGDEAAIEMAHEDVSLIYVDVDTAEVEHAGEVAYYAEHCLRAGQRVPQSALELIPSSDDYVWRAE